jgi:acyl-coenzyme A synthetase/AMP-(fatty) acid ligase
VAEGTRDKTSESGLVGPPVSGAEIQIVDEQGERVPSGETGIVRARTPYMASEYHNDIIETAKAFRQGWFYPGDLGYLDDRGSLHLSGRTSDVINAGGVKINPRQVEERVLSLEGISECAGVEVMGPSGVSEFGLAVVGPEGIDLTRLEKLLIGYFPFSYPTVYKQLEELPRNRNGKADLSAIKSRFEEGT